MKNHLIHSVTFLAFLILAESILPYYSYAAVAHPSRSDYHSTYAAKANKWGNSHENTLRMNTAPPIVPGGPGQPEASSFTPIDISNMVDPFTGDFSYNIPLLEIEGYPINLAYDANVGMSTESSWVGLGWNVNVGAVTRNLRGIPDDFNGERIEKELNVKDVLDVNINAAFNLELLGLDALKAAKLIELAANGQAGIGLNGSMGIGYNNYSGFYTSVSIGPEFSIASKSGFGLNAGFDLAGSSNNGPSINPTAGVSLGNERAGNYGLTVGAPFSSRMGLQEISYNLSASIRSKSESKKLGRNHHLKASGGSSYSLMQPTYVPTIRYNKKTSSVAGNFNVQDLDFFGADAGVRLSAGFSVSKNIDKKTSTPSYGYMYLKNGQRNARAILDYNTSNDGVITKSTPATSIPNITYDIFSVSGQGVGGSYIPFKEDFGYVFDPKSYNTSGSKNAGVEVGLGGIFKAGVNLGVVQTDGKSQVWMDNNNATKKIGFNSITTKFREANEVSVIDNANAFDGQFGGSKPSYYEMYNFGDEFYLSGNVKHTKGGKSSPLAKRSGYHRMNQFFNMITIGELKQGAGLNEIHPDQYLSDNDHHIGQISVQSVDGKTYYYGIAAYNILQNTYSFAVEGNPDSENQVFYTSQELSLNNKSGLDHHYSKETMGSYAHSYLLTAVVSDDYVDRDDVKGPSQNDLGNYYKFSYFKQNPSGDNYHWRNPATQDKASYSPGLFGTSSDQKGNFIYGKKELWYIQEIESRNQIAIFYTKPREDGYSVIDENGGLDSDPNNNQRYLEKIVLYNLKDYNQNGTNATPIKTVLFTYDYSLCSGYELNQSGGGKLTLKGVTFLYYNSYKGLNNSYKFDYYNNATMNYHPTNSDRWGNFKKATSNQYHEIQKGEFGPKYSPYNGFDENLNNEWAKAWKLKTITLPSKGSIEIEYESDSYAFVQNKRAMSMFKIVGKNGNVNTNHQTGNQELIDLSDNQRLTIEIGDVSMFSDNLYDYIDGIAGSEAEYVQGKQPLYFKNVAKIHQERYDMVPGYCYLKKSGCEIFIMNGKVYLILELQPIKLKDNGDSDYNPMILANINFARQNLNTFIPPSNQTPGESGFSVDLILSILGAFASYGEIIKGPNKALFDKEVGKEIVGYNSVVRLFSSNPNKLGGGHRVLKIKMKDNWNTMTNGTGGDQTYGQEYNYDIVPGVTSGVASYEPQTGGDENPFKRPLFYDIAYVLAPDDHNYMEEPFGEEFLPSPTVGYSKVTIKNIDRPNVTEKEIGKTVKEFYTSRDFPSFLDYNKLSQSTGSMIQHHQKLFLLVFSKDVQALGVSQGFVIENNDMHGKPKSEINYDSDGVELSSVRYDYHYENISAGDASWNRYGNLFSSVTTKKLKNNIVALDRLGNTRNSLIGLEYDQVSQFRESKTSMSSNRIEANYNQILFLGIPVVFGNISKQNTAFNSASLVKTIKRFGVLKSTTARTSAGAIVKTENLLYDSETGEVLLTRVNTDYDDTLYNLKIPAHWYYDGMGQAYRSGQLKYSFVNGRSMTNGSISGIGTKNGFTKGDELVLKLGNGSGFHRVWIMEANFNSIKVKSKDGTAMNATVYGLLVVRSGRKNLASTTIETIVTRTNPTYGLSRNIFSNVLQSSAIEFTDDWGVYCQCEDQTIYGANFYTSGKKGRWKPKTNSTYLTGRGQTFYNNNTDIQNDGYFKSYNPFYKRQGNVWKIDRTNWTYTEENKRINNMGLTAETRDALGRHTGSSFAFNHTLVDGIAVNSRQTQMGTESFEDEDGSCHFGDFHFEFSTQHLSMDRSHSGEYSIRVPAGDLVEMNVYIGRDCDESVECYLDIQASVELASVPSKKKLIVSPVNGTPNYQYEYQILYGNPTDIYFSDNNEKICFEMDLQSRLIIKVKIIDANGCIIEKTIDSNSLIN